MENKLITSIILIFTTLFGVGIGELLDEKVHIPILEVPQALLDEVENYCSTTIIAYTDDAKYFCKCIGPECPCEKTEEILTELG